MCIAFFWVLVFVKIQHFICLGTLIDKYVLSAPCVMYLVMSLSVALIDVHSQNLSCCWIWMLLQLMIIAVGILVFKPH